MAWQRILELLKRNALLFLLIPQICGIGAMLIAYDQLISSDKSHNSYYGYKQSILASLGAYAPYAFMEKGGMLDGFIIQLTHAIGREMRVRVDVVSRKLDDTQEAAMVRDDVKVVLCMVKTPRTTRYFDFTKPYAINGFTLVKRKGAPMPANYRAELDKGGFVFNRDGVYYELHANNLHNFGTAPTAEDALLLLENGTYNYTVLENYVAQRLLGTLFLKNVEIAGEIDELVEYRFGIRKGNPELLEIFSHGMRTLQESGEFDKIQRHWVEERFLISKRARNAVISSILIGGGVSLFVTVLFFIWLAMLKQEVKARSVELSSEVKVRKRTEAQLLTNQAQLIQADKLAAIGTLASGIAHEINNPNGLLLLNISLLKRLSTDVLRTLDEHQIDENCTLAGIPYPMLREHLPNLLKDMEGASTRIGEIVDDLKDFARTDSTQRDNLYSLNEPTQAALRLLEHTLWKTTERLEVVLDPGLPLIRGSSQKTEQVLINLIVNACQALENRQQGIYISTECSADKTEVRFVIKDEGCGIPAENIPLLRDPFFTTKRETGGTGLGLSISDTIIKAHCGTMEIESKHGEGTKVTLHLPTAERKGNDEEVS